MATTVSEKYLIMVTINNNNKYYKMIPISDGTHFKVIYGRVGNAGQEKIYPLSDFQKIYNAKISKGYVDKTAIMNVTADDEISEITEIKDPSVKYLVDTLRSLARQTIKKNYRISPVQVTEEMIVEAEKILGKMSSITDHILFNIELMKLFEIIPRKMTNVISYTARKDEDVEKIIQRESDLFDVMKGQFIMNKNRNVEQITPKEVDFLSFLGLEIRNCTPKELEEIKKNLDPDTRKNFGRAWSVRNIKTEQNFSEYCKERNIAKCKFLYHGSRSENWWSIINNGLLVKPTQVIITGKMFGYGIYFATKAQKSYGYTSGCNAYWTKGSSHHAYMGIYKVAYGNPLNSYDNQGYSNYTEKDVLNKGCDSLHAHAGRNLRNDEIIVYNNHAATIRFLIELDV